MVSVKRSDGRGDFALGFVVLSCIEGFLCAQVGMVGFFMLVWVYCAFVIYLCNAGTPFRKVFAFILLPAILLRLLLPRDLRNAVNALPSDQACPPAHAELR